MKGYRYQFIVTVVLAGIFLIFGCASSPQQSMKTDDEKTAKVIAVLPVDNKTPDSQAPCLLRTKILDELYFKGYSKLPLEVIDKKLAPLYKNTIKSAGIVAPHVVKELIGADAVMYCTLSEGERSKWLFYAPMTVAASCELRSTQTGEILWRANCRSTSRNFDITSKRLEMKTYENFEALIEEVVNKVMETFPDGPNLKG